MAQPSYAPKRQKGESESSYKKRYYTAQRQDAEKRGRAGSDTAQAEVRKIYGKLGRKAPQTASGGGTDRVDNAILGGVALLGGGRAKVAADAVEGTAKGIGSALARRGEQQVARKGTSIVSKAASRVKPKVSAKVERPALGGGKSSALANRSSSSLANRSTSIAKRAPIKAAPARAATVTAAPTSAKNKRSKKK